MPIGSGSPQISPTSRPTLSGLLTPTPTNSNSGCLTISGITILPTKPVPKTTTRFEPLSDIHTFRSSAPGSPYRPGDVTGDTMWNMTSHLRGPSILLAVGIGLANACGVANAIPSNPRVTYEVSGPAVAEWISYQSDNGQQRALNAKLPWSTQFTAFGGEVFALSAQGPGPIS